MAARVPDTGTLRGDLLGLLSPVSELLATDLGKTMVHAALSESTASSVGGLVARQLANTSAPILRVIEGARAKSVLLEHEALTAKWLSDLVDLVDLALLGTHPRERRR